MVVEEKIDENQEEIKIKIEGMPFEFMEEFMTKYVNEHPELAGMIKLQKVVPMDSKGIELKANQEIKQISNGEFFHIDEKRTFRNELGEEVDFNHNGENVYEDLEVVSIKF